MDVNDLRRYMTRAVKCAERIMYDAYDDGDRETALKAVTRLTQASHALLKVVEADELVARVEALEAAMEERQNARGDGAPALSTYP
jgi:hypothetical protein